VEVPLADTSWHIPWTRATTGEKRISLTSLSADRSPSRRSAPASAWAAQGPCVAVLWRQGHPHLVGDIRQGLHSLIDKLRQFRSTSSGNPKRRSFLVIFFEVAMENRYIYIYKQLWILTWTGSQRLYGFVWK
jgi:hypothetical protein